MRTFPLSALPNSSIFNKIIAQLFNNLCWICHDKCTFWCSILCRMHKTSLTGQFQTCRNSSELQPASGRHRWRPSFRWPIELQVLSIWLIDGSESWLLLKQLKTNISSAQIVIFCERVLSSWRNIWCYSLSPSQVILYLKGCWILLNVISVMAWSLV